MANKINMIAGLYKAFASERRVVTGTAGILSSSKYIDSSGEYAKRALITVETAAIRYTYDGTTPTSSYGHILNEYDILVIIGSDNIKNFKAIKNGTNNANLQISYEN